MARYKTARPKKGSACVNRHCTRGGFRYTCTGCGRTCCQQHCTAKDRAKGTALCTTCARRIR